MKYERLFAVLDADIEADKRGSDASVYRRLRIMVSYLARTALYVNGVDPLTGMEHLQDDHYIDPLMGLLGGPLPGLHGSGYMGDSLVNLQAIDEERDILVIDWPNRALTLRTAHGKEIILGRQPKKRGKGYLDATSALQRSQVQGNVWNRVSLAVAVGGRLCPKDYLTACKPRTLWQKLGKL